MDSQLALLFSALAFLFSLFSFLFFKFYLKKRTSKDYILSEYWDEANQIIKTINQATERDLSLIEERQQNLRILLQETEKRISVYIKEVERSQEAEAVHAQLSSQRKSSGEAYQELGKKRYKMKEQALLPLEELKENERPENEAKLEDKALSEQIISLLHSGFSVPLIASSLKISIAEVEIAAAMLEGRGKE